VQDGHAGGCNRVLSLFGSGWHIRTKASYGCIVGCCGGSCVGGHMGWYLQTRKRSQIVVHLAQCTPGCPTSLAPPIPAYSTASALKGEWCNMATRTPGCPTSFAPTSPGCPTSSAPPGPAPQQVPWGAPLSATAPWWLQWIYRRL